eukprot:SAG22_NODE_2403_length_2613_cov_2.627685_2_plen_126_part_00
MHAGWNKIISADIVRSITPLLLIILRTQTLASNLGHPEPAKPVACTALGLRGDLVLCMARGRGGAYYSSALHHLDAGVGPGPAPAGLNLGKDLPQRAPGAVHGDTSIVDAVAVDVVLTAKKTFKP